MEQRYSHSNYGEQRCNDTRERLYVRQTPQGELQYCHNCGYKKFIPNRNKTPSQIIQQATHLIKINEETYELSENNIYLPSDFSNNLPSAGRQWLDKYQITEQERTQFNIGYSERYHRVILPVYRDEQLVYWQGRYLKQPTKENPKYLNVRNKGAKNVFFKRCNTGCDSICVVEDILSAIKVGRVTNSLAILGSYFSKEIINELKSFKHIYIWLDEDKYFTAVKAGKKLNAILNVPIKIIHTTLDPKEYNEQQIKETLYEKF